MATITRPPGYSQRAADNSTHYGTPLVLTQARFKSPDRAACQDSSLTFLFPNVVPQPNPDMKLQDGNTESKKGSNRWHRWM